MEQKTQLITRDTTIGEIVQNYPEAVLVLSEYGFHCMGCHGQYFDTVETGAQIHGLNNEEIDVLVEKLNNSINQEQGEKITITEEAINKIKELAKKENKTECGLRIQVIEGGCNGYQYVFEFEDNAKQDDFVLEEKELKIYLDPLSHKYMQGAKVHYVDSINGAGFKITGIKASSQCGCGTSFS